MNLLPLFQWFDSTALSKVIRDSTYIFPVVEVFHLFGLTLLLGTVTVMSMRMLGLGMRRQSVYQVARNLMPWSFWAAVLTIVSGILLFLSEAMKCYGNAAFPWKMYFLGAGILVYLLWQRRVAHPDSKMGSGQLKVLAIVTLVLWYGVALAGRAIAFV